MPSPLLIVGASVRAAAQSARRAGFAPLAIDMFADVDLREIADARRSERYPDDLPSIASELPAAPFLYTGALENSPEILRTLQTNRPLWGNGEKSLRLVRDPVWIQEVLSAAGFPVLPTKRTPPGSSEKERWLRKPLASAAGMRIEFDSPSPATNEFYWQQFVPGIPISAFYIADAQRSQLIGCARQWVGWPEFPVGPFQFCGAIAPASFSEVLLADLKQIGTRFAELADLRGLFGIDLVLHEERAYVVELNPRPTATLELYDRIFDRSFLGDHADVFRGIEVPDFAVPEAPQSAAKLIWYAAGSGETPPLEFWNELNGNSKFPAVADLPAAGQPLVAGQPVCTILADGASEEQVRESLFVITEKISCQMEWSTHFPRLIKGLKLG